MEYEIGAPGRAYTEWAAKMAVGLGTGIPWIMCKQDDAPDRVVRSLELSLVFCKEKCSLYFLLISGFTSLHLMMSHCIKLSFSQCLIRSSTCYVFI